MGLTHLGLPVRDLDRARVFYETWFGFDAGPAQRYADGTLFLRNAEGFDLALHPVGSAAGGAAMPTFFHFGFRFSSADAVRALTDRLSAAGVDVMDRSDEPHLVSTKVRDPDGYVVELYWEPPPQRGE
jgi:catechol 2,3-dioxygenase-like lactoylglutathione lyase family enzyme